MRAIAGEREPDLVHPYAVATFGEAVGTGPGGGTAVGPARIAVSDMQVRGVFVFDLAAGDYQLLTSAGGTSLASPVGVAFDGDGRLYVCDSALGRIVRYGTDLAFDRVVTDQFERPAGVAIDRKRGRLYVADAAQHIVRRLDLEGRTAGVVALPFAFPTHLAVDDSGRLLVSDSMDFQVVVVSSEGERLGAVGKVGDGSGDLQRPKGVASDSVGHLYVVDAIFDNVQIFSMDGRLLLSFGSAGNGMGEMALPAGIATDPRDTIYVADTYNGRVLVLQYLPEPTP